MIKVKELYKKFDEKVILEGININFKPKSITSILGKSGEGKTTLLRCLNLLSEPDDGHIYFLGSDLMDPKTNLEKLRMRIGMVFQSFNLFNNKLIFNP